MGLFFRIVVMVLALSGILYFMYKLNTEGINKNVFYLEDSSVAFDIYKVQKLEWKTQTKISLLEKSPQNQWIPLDRENQIYKILNMLSVFSLSELEQKGAPQIQVSLDIDGTTWMGAWDGMTFLWTQGPLKGKGAILTEAANKLFFRGKFVFEPDQEIEVCKNPIQKIRISVLSQEFWLTQENSQWTLATKTQKYPIKSEFITPWLSQSCNLKVSTTIDPSYSPQVPRQVNRLTFYSSNEQANYDFFNLEKDLVMANDRALVLPGYEKLFEALKAYVEEAIKK